MWAAIAETANQVLGFAGGVTPVVTAFHEQIKNLRFDPEAHEQDLLSGRAGCGVVNKRT
jgi:hypothetical protein